MRKAIYSLGLILISQYLFAQIPVATWQPVGPTLFPYNGSGQINGIGRVTNIKFDPQIPSTLYATSASGGLWISRDSGDHWVGTGTDQMPHHSEATICIDYTNSNILYLGTGDPNYYSSGLGVWKSTDGGLTWHSSNTGMGNVLVDELLMDPTNHSTLIAVTDNGIYKSYNSGATWVHKLNRGRFTDMDFKPFSGGRVIYACTFDSLYRSDDSGEHWQTVTNGFYIPGGSGGNGLRTAVTPADSNIVYLGMVANRGSLFKSTDGGLSFAVVKDSFALSLTGYSSTDGGQGDYNFDFNVDPTDPSTLYWVSHTIWKSSLGGIPSSWNQLTQWWEIVHTDMHHIVFSPTDHLKLYNANDGAIWMSTDSAATWVQRSDGLAATEIAPAASSKLDRKTISIGTQDNGELYHDSIWITNRGGDWYEYMAYDYLNPHTVYYANGNRRIVSAGDQGLNLPFVQDFNSIAFSPLNFERAFTGRDTLVRTSNLNASSPTWDIIHIFTSQIKAIASSPVDSNKLFVITDDDSLHICSNALAPAPTFTSHHTPASTYNTAGIVQIDQHPNVLYMYNGSDIYRSADTGLTWTSVVYNYPNTLDIVGMVHDKYTIDESIFIANTDGVYYRNSSMASWQNYSHGLPTVANIQGLDVYNDGSAQSALRTQYYGRGIWEAPINTSKTVATNFVSDIQYVCAGNQVHFYDSSYNSPNTWSWSFPGGNPPTSSSPDPIVTYSSPGSYTVTLQSGNGVGYDTKVRQSYIYVYKVDTLVPVSQGFEGGVFPPTDWVDYDGGHDSITWWLAAGYGAYGTSRNSMFFNNYSYNETGKSKNMQFGTDLSHTDSAVLTFDVAYQTLQGYIDSLEVTASLDCGQTFRRIYCRGGNDLATAPHLDSPSAPFYPTATQWRTESVNMLPFSFHPGVIISFNNLSGYGTDIYVDNINLNGIHKLYPSGIDPIGNRDGISIYPNPSRGNINITWSRVEAQSITLGIYDMLGEKVKELSIPFPGPDGNTSLDASALNDGMYFVRAEGRNAMVTKLTILK